jgi:predicted DsbA family dithiol-disulfide isomerase
MDGPDAPRFYFDYVDPLSWLVALELDAALADGETLRPMRLPFELRPPPAPLLDPDGSWWRERWRAATTLAAAHGRPTPPSPLLLPWTRKAHELVLHAAANGVGDEAHRAVFQAFFEGGEDIGRVDVLVRLGRALDLDSTETKVVLDVDRYAEEVATHVGPARAAGTEPPLLVRGPEVLRGFHNRDAVRTFLRR